MSYKVEGSKELIAKLNALKKTDAKAAIRKGTRAGAKIVQAAAKELAPVDTGKMRDAIKVRSLPRSRVWTGTDVKLDNADTYYYSFVELGTKRSKATGFLKDAAEQSKDEAIDVAIEITKEEIERRMK